MDIDLEIEVKMCSQVLFEPSCARSGMFGDACRLRRNHWRTACEDFLSPKVAWAGRCTVAGYMES